MLFENILTTFPIEIQFKHKRNSLRIMYIDYADNLVITSSTPDGLNVMMKNMEPALDSVGLLMNISKSICFCWGADGKSKRMVYGEDP